MQPDYEKMALFHVPYAPNDRATQDIMRFYTVRRGFWINFYDKETRESYGAIWSE